MHAKYYRRSPLLLLKLVRLARYARLYKKCGLKILIERYYPLLCSKQHRIDVLS